MKHISVIPATLADAKDIAGIHHNAWQESYKGIIDQDYLDALRFEDFLIRRHQILNSP